MRMAVFAIGGMGREVAPLAEAQARCGCRRDSPDDIVFVDDDPTRPAICNGLAVIGFDELVSPAHRDREVVVAVGNGRVRESIESRCLGAGLRIGSVVAPTARILHGNEIAAGAVICDFATVTCNVRIGRSFQANFHAHVAHDCVIGDFVTFGPQACSNGNVVIGDYAYIGAGAVLIQGRSEAPLRIGEGAVVGMGAVVTKAVEAFTVVVGNPARPIRKLAIAGTAPPTGA